MKSQDILLLLKLVSLERSNQAQRSVQGGAGLWRSKEWQGWLDLEDDPGDWSVSHEEGYALRALEASTGISKTEIGVALRRMIQVGLAKLDRRTGNPRTNTRSLFEFIVYGLKYVFPASPGALGRGIPTAASAPVLADVLLSPGGQALVWEDSKGTVMGQLVEPLYRSVPHAVRRDPGLYAMLALVDSIRTGHEREAGLAQKLLKKQFERTSDV